MQSQYKITILGDYGVGKSSLIERFINNRFEDVYKETVLTSYHSKLIQINNQSIRLNLWDTSGHPKFSHIVPMYCNHSSAVIIAYDLTDKNGLRKAMEYHQNIVNTYNAQNKNKPLIYFVGCKLDLIGSQQQIKPKLNETFETPLINDVSCQDFFFYQISSQNGQNIANLFEDIIHKLAGFDSKKNSFKESMSKSKSKSKLDNETKIYKYWKSILKCCC